jgi:hypothetical protein
MDEWMLLTGGEAAHRQQAQRAMRSSAHPRRATAIGRRVRAALATALVALAARLDPAGYPTTGPEAAPTLGSPAA